MTLLGEDPRSLGSYTLESRLGAGGMGVVYLARTLSGRKVAVKVIRPELAQDPGFRDRFRREVAAARRVSGAFTAPVVDADPESDTPWLATLYVPGPSLAERVLSQGPLTVPEVRRLAAGLAEALRDIHRAGLVHRDLKPGNVLLAQDGPRVIDFGISRAADATQLTHAGTVVGTPPFMAPEQFRSADVGPAADVFSLGSVLVYAATGHGPFDGDTSHAIGFRVVYEQADLAGLSEELCRLVVPCLAKDPALRPTVEQLLDGLTQADREAGGHPAPTLAFTRPAPKPATAPALPYGPPSSAPNGVRSAPAPAGRRVKRVWLAAAAACAVLAAAVPLVVKGLPGGDSDKAGPSTSPSASATHARPTVDPSCGAAGSLLRGAGSSMQQRAMSSWTAGYTRDCSGAQVSYEGSGAGVGFLDFQTEKSDFALLDDVMTPAQAKWAGRRCGPGGALQIPVTTLPIAVVVNLRGVDEVTVDARTLSMIFQGSVTRWNDPMLAALNRGRTLPDRKINTIHQLGTSTTTLAFTHYLSEAAPDIWKYRPSGGMPEQTGQGAPGPQEVAELVAKTEGSISYVAMQYMKSMELTPAYLDTGGSRPVGPTPESVTAGAATAQRVTSSGTDMAMDIDHAMRGKDAYPIVRFGYAVLCGKGDAAGKAAGARGFFTHIVSEDGQRSAAELGYGRLPDELIGQVRDVLRAAG
ncbi:serine/threonine-protein kinase [Streptomyces sp. PTY087I2]|uniref:serine/threonine-protein kinase n=1 Tax=Streptomyces sp. PTY087I2 TaxID=1819298 RepID=UPI000829479A|nr:serine/threonine-protein kinase [Streptomyces sp. PTY087I2]OCC08390.1 Serine/threonine-protein kinase AfsK [Streptomyces sp. PTY087I2]